MLRDLCGKKMNLEVLPTRSAGAAENMATDFLLLQRYPQMQEARFRAYGWHRPAFTFGYSQQISFVREQLTSSAKASEGTPPDGPFDLCRRATGGGVVDHRDDWTYALVIPRGHVLEEQSATHSYRVIHEALAGALASQGVPAVAKPAAVETVTGPAGVCFQRAEMHDVIHADSGEKIAGAAQKRNKHGLLFQGSVWRPAAGAAVDWEKFYGDFVAQLGAALDVGTQPAPWPEFNEDELSGLVEKYTSPEWMEFR